MLKRSLRLLLFELTIKKCFDFISHKTTKKNVQQLKQECKEQLRETGAHRRCFRQKNVVFKILNDGKDDQLEIREVKDDGNPWADIKNQERAYGYSWVIPESKLEKNC